jgi:hypothetical protein
MAYSPKRDHRARASIVDSTSAVSPSGHKRKSKPPVPKETLRLRRN